MKIRFITFLFSAVLSAALSFTAHAQDEDPLRDTDYDGVIDAEDKCPYDPGAAKNKGCL